MFLLRSPPTQPPGPTLNATPAPHPEDRAQRRARLLRVCERLTDLGMELTEGAHREALKEFEPAPRRKYSFPGMPEMPGLPDPAPFRSTIFNELFVELSRCVRQAVLLEARIDAGACDHPRRDAPLTPRPTQDDPVPDTQPRQPSNQTRLSHERLEDDLAGDRNRAVPEILTEICETLGRAADAGLATDLPHTLFPAAPGQNQPGTRPRRDQPKRPPAAPPGTQARNPPPGTQAKPRISAAPERPPPPD